MLLKHWCIFLVHIYTRVSVGYVPKSGNTSPKICRCLFLTKIDTGFPGACASLHLHHKLLSICLFVCFCKHLVLPIFFSILDILIVVSYYVLALIAFFWRLMMLSTFSYEYWQLRYPLGENTYSNKSIVYIQLYSLSVLLKYAQLNLSKSDWIQMKNYVWPCQVY